MTEKKPDPLDVETQGAFSGAFVTIDVDDDDPAANVTTRQEEPREHLGVPRLRADKLPSMEPIAEVEVQPNQKNEPPPANPDAIGAEIETMAMDRVGIPTGMDLLPPPALTVRRVKEGETVHPAGLDKDEIDLLKMFMGKEATAIIKKPEK